MAGKKKVNCQLPNEAPKKDKPLVGECQLKGLADLTKPKNPVGRPTDYDIAHCETVVELGRKGYSKAMMAAELDVTRKTLDNWADEHPEFLRAITRARELSLAWWEAQGQLGVWGEGFNAQAYKLQVCNRFPDDWREKVTTELTGKDGAAIQHAHKHELTDDMLAAIAAGKNG